jgi:uncharacterized phage-associated protein
MARAEKLTSEERRETVAKMEMNSPMMGHAAPRVNLKPNVGKILAAIAYVVAFGETRKLAVTQYDILKTFFLADKAHLNKYGRPITFDNYVAMRAGPVPSLTYDFLKEKQSKLKQLRISALPWSRSGSTGGRFFYSNADIKDVDEALSESDKKALADAFTTIKSLTFVQIKKLTHDDPAYKEAWREESEQKAFLMSMGMLFDSPDFEEAEALEFQSRNT